jgi:hypothetical protein
VKEVKLKQLELTKEGEQILANGSHEYNVFKLVGEQGVPKTVIDVRNKRKIREIKQNSGRAIWPNRFWEGHPMWMDFNRGEGWSNNCCAESAKCRGYIQRRIKENQTRRSRTVSREGNWAVEEEKMDFRNVINYF